MNSSVHFTVAETPQMFAVAAHLTSLHLLDKISSKANAYYGQVGLGLVAREQRLSAGKLRFALKNLQRACAALFFSTHWQRVLRQPTCAFCLPHHC